MGTITLPLALGAALIAQSGTTREPSPVARETFGAFELVEWVVPRESLLIHATGDGGRLTLSIGEADYQVSLTDNGSIVAISIQSSRCGGAMRHLLYEGRIGEPRLFAAMHRFTAQVAPQCGLPPGRHRALLNRLRASRADFTSGVQRMKARAETLFGGWRMRCRPPPPARPGEILFPSPHDPCA